MTTPTPTPAELAPAGYPVTADGWVTYQRIPHPQGRGVLLVQKRDGCTRTIHA